jgi:hypothetical protein
MQFQELRTVSEQCVANFTNVVTTAFVAGYRSHDFFKLLERLCSCNSSYSSNHGVSSFKVKWCTATFSHKCQSSEELHVLTL